MRVPSSYPLRPQLGVVLGVVLAGFLGVMRGMVEMTLSDVGVMPGFHVIAPFMVLGCGQVVFRGVFMVFRRLSMVLDGFLGHEIFSSKGLSLLVCQVR
jgi:hypothetical protein